MQTLGPYPNILKPIPGWGPVACIFLERLPLHLWVSTLAKSAEVLLAQSSQESGNDSLLR